MFIGTLYNIYAPSVLTNNCERGNKLSYMGVIRKKKKALITGASDGIGRAFAQRLARRISSYRSSSQ